MRLRPVLLSALAVGLVAGGSSLAAPKTVCKLIVDAAGDGTHKSTGLKTEALDILGGDLATGKNTVVGTIKVKSLNTSSDPFAYLKYSWMLSFQIGGQDFNWEYSRVTGPSGPRDSYSASFADQAGEVTASLSGDTITFKSPRKAFASTLVKKPGKHNLDNIVATSWLMGGNADTASGGATKYLDLTPSCLKPA